MKIGILSDTRADVEVLRRTLALAPEHQLLWVAAQSKEAVELFAHNAPDLILMDIATAGNEAIEATRRIAAQSVCAVLIVTRSIDSNAARVFEAMRQGALDAVELPAPAGGDLRLAGAPLLAKIAMLGKLASAPEKPILNEYRTSHRRRPTMIAIGASAGGPAALATLLRDLPPSFSASIVVVQHVDDRFAAGMADWLGQHSSLPVRLAREGDQPVPGTVMVAGATDHLVLKTPDRLGYVSEPRDYAYRPSIDVFFRSVGALWPGRVIGVLLTGMGADGAKGLTQLRQLGHHTIAQDQATSVVYGMPKAAAAANAAVEVLPLPRIALRLASLACGARMTEKTP